MRFVYLDPHAVPGDTPEALQILYTVDGLAEAGADITLVTPAPNRPIVPGDILGRRLAERATLHPLIDPRKRWWFPITTNKPFYFFATRTLKRLAPDIVFVRNLKMAEYLLRHVPSIPLVFETHEVFAQTYREDHPHPDRRERRKLAALEARERLVYTGAAGLIALTQPLLDDIRRVYDMTTPGVVAPDGVDLRQAAVVPTSAVNPVPLLLYLGSLHPWKGVDTLILAMKYVQQPARLAIVGGNAARIAELSALAQREGVTQRIVFVGAVEPGRRFEWIHRADICLLPLTATSIGSRYTSPLKLFEYMAAGKPIVVSDLPSMRAVLVPERSALMVENSKPERFARAIDRLLSEPALARRLGTAARERARDFSWQARAFHIRDFVARLIDKKSA